MSQDVGERLDACMRLEDFTGKFGTVKADENGGSGYLDVTKLETSRAADEKHLGRRCLSGGRQIGMTIDNGDVSASETRSLATMSEGLTRMAMKRCQ
jgi:hypothetical protein